MNGLDQLRTRLARLSLGRALLHTAVIACGLIVAAGVTLLGVFLVDWSTDASSVLRAGVVIAGVLFGGVLWRRWGRVRRHPRESVVQMALLVERERGIDTDLVAALQFDGANAQGSPELIRAVREYVAEAAAHLDLRGLIPYRRLTRPVAAAAGVMVIGAGLVVGYPDHARAYARRLLMQDAYYPTETMLELAAVQGLIVQRGDPPVAETVLPVDGTSPHPLPTVTVVRGTPLKFRVTARGMIPDEGVLTVTSRDSRDRVTYPLVRTDAEAGDAVTTESDVTAFVAELGSLNEPADLRVDLGDARFPGITLETVNRPIVRLQFVAEPPAYARAVVAEREQRTRADASSLPVLEGSRVLPELRCLSGQLRQATVSLNGRDIPLTPAPASGADVQIWRPAEHIPELESLTESLSYEVHAVDEYGLEPEHPPRGVLQMSPDHGPGGVLEVVTTHVLPTGTPTLDFRAWDEYGVSRVEAVVKVDDRRDDAPLTVALYDTLDNRLGDAPLRKVAAAQRIDLSSLNLQPGDRLKIYLRIVDERGDRPGAVVTSAESILDVTDRDGLMSRLLEIDRRSATTLDRIIEQELGVEESP